MNGWINALFYTVGGLGLFLYGMRQMSDGLKASAGDRLRNILALLTRNRVIALLVGTGVTALIQSSSATTVMVVGFVNAGLLTLQQAVSVVLGANIGTTMTAWLVSIIGKFHISAYALPAIGVGFFLFAFSKNKKVKDAGQILFGFGMLFLGLDFMKEAFEPLRDNQQIIDIFASFSRNPLLGVLVGVIFTMVLQSSSATIAIIQLLAFNGVITFDAAIPVILGDNIGTTITAQIGAIGTTVNARRTAMAHSLFNVLGTLIILPFAWTGLYGRFVDWVFPGPVGPENIMMHLATAHSLFNIINAAIFSVLVRVLVAGAIWLVPSRKGEEARVPKLLDENLLDNPEIAMQQVVRELIRMLALGRQAVCGACEAFFRNDTKLIPRVQADEDALDDFQRAITRYLIKISERHLDTRESMEYPILLHSVNDVEKVGDYASNIAAFAEIKISRKLVLPAEATKRVEVMFGRLNELFEKVARALREHDEEHARQGVLIEDEIDRLKVQCRELYIEGLKKQQAAPEALIMVMDLATNIEKIGDHLVNIAKAVLKDLQWGRKMELRLGDDLKPV